MSTSSCTISSTSNHLTPSQRMRLMRSTRKLGEMLGTTPVFDSSSSVLDQRPSAAPSRSSPTISLHHTSSPRSKSKALPRPLVLSLQSRPAALSSSRPPLSPTTPLSPTSISTNLASTPSLRREESEYQNYLQQTRRKRMAKLTRTLGENIPPELVFSHPTSRSRSPSVDAAALATFTVSVKDLSSESSHRPQETVIPIYPQSSPVPHSPSPSAMPRSTSLRAPSSSFVARRMMRKGPGHSHGHGYTKTNTLAHVQLVVPPPTSGRTSSDTIRSTSSSLSTASEPTRRSGETKRTYRKQAGWSGEWNRQDMDEVMHRLRGLKAA
ncbi:hypothetical protein FB446DRAFT_238718 [Lentinula raphanica]|nr:hypothetical protein FB446DRAFT_238718 [Lentinula raphanica]